MYNSRFFCIALLTIIFSICAVFHTAEAEPISISSNNDIYYLGDYVVVFGSVDTVFEGMPVTIQIYYESSLIDVAQVPVAKDGTFAASFTADGQQWKDDGTYTVRAQYSTNVIGELTFEFYNQVIDTSSAAFPVDIPNSGTFDVGYTIRGGEVKNIEMDSERYSILIQTSMDTNGNLVLKLPRESFDAKNDGTDESFIVLVSKENTSAENFVNVEYEEVGTSSDYRTIRIPLENDDKWIEVIGTYVIPEFGSIVVIILVVAITSTIIISKSRFSVRYN
jgi:predicted secreted protein with PEFG-CTERM motif